MENNNSGNKFFSGFLWGAIIGGGLVFLLSTKKGKKLLQLISDKGLEGLSGLISDNEILDDEYDEDEELAESDKPADREVNREVKENTSHNGETKIKRFFKGISKKI